MLPSALISALLAGLAVVVLLGRGDSGRLATALPAPTQPSASARAPSTPAVACALAGAAAALVVAPPAGVVIGGLLAVAGPRLLARLEPQAVRDERTLLLAELPLVLDLLASCLAGGAPLPEAASAVAAAVPGPAGRRLAAVAAALTVGSPPGEAWAALSGGLDLGGSAEGALPGGGLRADPAARSRSWVAGSSVAAEDPLAPAARALSRAADGGAPVAAAVARMAVEVRADARSTAEQAARRVGVLVVAPLGLCFLPAFVLLGVLPVVAGLAGPLVASF